LKSSDRNLKTRITAAAELVPDILVTLFIIIACGLTSKNVHCFLCAHSVHKDLYYLVTQYTCSCSVTLLYSIIFVLILWQTSDWDFCSLSHSHHFFLIRHNYCFLLPFLPFDAM
jgi:hypothetical protein